MKIDIIVQARTGSSRLPEKVLNEIGDEPMLQFLLKRLLTVDRVDEVILATSNLSRDDRLVKIGHEVGVRVVRGSEEDVLSRFTKAAKTAGSNIILRVCADNPLVDPEIVDRAAKLLLSGDIDHVSTFEQHTYPYGVGCGGFTEQTLFDINSTVTSSNDREHVEPAMLRRDDIETHYMKAPDRLARPEIRVTVDHEFQYQKVRRIAESLKETHGYDFTTEDVIRFIDECPIVVFANGDLGYRCVKYLCEQEENIAGLVLHPPHEAKRRDDIVDVVGLDNNDIISPDNLDDDWIVSWINKRSPEIILSFWSSFIFPEDLIDIPPRGVVNLHNSLLPYCRGSGANIWTILENNPGGVTMHYMSKNVDEGPIIEQTDVSVRSYDTGRSLFYRLQEAMVSLFKQKWSSIKSGPVKTRNQEGEGSFHYYNEADQHRELDLDKEFTVSELIDRLRAFSFSPYEGCYFIDENGDRININIELNRGITTKKSFDEEDLE